MRIARIVDGTSVTYEFTSKQGLDDQIEIWKKEFRGKNQTDKILSIGSRDRYYERYCSELERISNEYRS